MIQSLDPCFKEKAVFAINIYFLKYCYFNSDEKLLNY